MKPERDVPASHVEKSGPNTADPYTGKGTGEAGPETSAQAAGLTPADLIKSNPVLHIDLTAADTPRGLVAIEINHTPDYPPATIPNEAMPHLVGLINALKVAHLNEAAMSLRTIADRMPDTASAAELRPGIEYAATLLGHTADDLTEGATHDRF